MNNALTPVAELASIWRAEADRLRRWGSEAQATVLVLCAEDLEAALRAAETEALTIRAAARESGYSEDHLGALVRLGKIANAGRPHAPRILRRDLPKRPGGATARNRASFPSIVREVSASRARR